MLLPEEFDTSVPSRYGATTGVEDQSGYDTEAVERVLLQVSESGRSCSVEPSTSLPGLLSQGWPMYYRNRSAAQGVGSV